MTILTTAFGKFNNPDNYALIQKDILDKPCLVVQDQNGVEIARGCIQAGTKETRTRLITSVLAQAGLKAIEPT